MGWQEQFKGFLNSQDDRWTKLLEAIEESGEKPMTKEKEAAIEKTLGLDDIIEDFKERLHNVLVIIYKRKM